MPLFHSLHSHRSRRSDTNNHDDGNDDATLTTMLKDQRTDDISSNGDNRKVIPMIESLPVLRTRHDFQLLESKIQKWKESQVGPIQNILCNQIVLSTPPLQRGVDAVSTGFFYYFHLYTVLLAFRFFSSSSSRSFHFRLNTLKNGSLIMR